MFPVVCCSDTVLQQEDGTCPMHVPPSHGMNGQQWCEVAFADNQLLPTRRRWREPERPQQSLQRLRFCLVGAAQVTLEVQGRHVVTTTEDKEGQSEIFQFLSDCCNHHYYVRQKCAVLFVQQLHQAFFQYGYFWYIYFNKFITTYMFHIVIRFTRCSAIAERPRYKVRYSFRQKWKTATGRQYFTDIIVLSSTTVI